MNVNRDTRKSGRDGAAAATVAALIGVVLGLDAEQQLQLVAAVGILQTVAMLVYRRVRTWRGITP